ncbi:MAG: ABC transporter permease, partial [Deltaproteobacteria bacterium]|nr:ABC transporter permease [Deltaproteobacteria bacterium]
SVVSISGLMIIFFFSINMVSNDLERRTIYMILSRPINKVQYIFGKFIGLSLIVLLSSIILGCCSAVSVKLATLNAAGYIPQHFSWSTFFIGLVFLTLSLWLVMSMAFLCISITSHPFTAVLISILSYFIGHNIEAVANIITRSQIYAENAFLIKLTQIAAWVFPNLAAFDLKTTAAYGLSIDPAYLCWVALYGFSYIGICLMLTIFMFQRRELS